MLSFFENIYCLEKEGGLNRIRMKEFTGYLEKESESTASRLKHIFLPDEMVLGEEPFSLEKSLYGSLGDYVRNWLGGPKIE